MWTSTSYKTLFIATFTCFISLKSDLNASGKSDYMAFYDGDTHRSPSVSSRIASIHRYEDEKRFSPESLEQAASTLDQIEGDWFDPDAIVEDDGDWQLAEERIAKQKKNLPSDSGYTTVVSKRAKKRANELRVKLFEYTLKTTLNTVTDAMREIDFTADNYESIKDSLCVIPLMELIRIDGDWDQALNVDGSYNLNGLLTYVETHCLLNRYLNWSAIDRTARLTKFFDTFEALAKIPPFFRVFRANKNRVSSLFLYLTSLSADDLDDMFDSQPSFKELKENWTDFGPMDTLVTHFMKESSDSGVVQLFQLCDPIVNAVDAIKLRKALNSLSPEQYHVVPEVFSLLAGSPPQAIKCAPELVTFLSHFPPKQMREVASALLTSEADNENPISSEALSSPNLCKALTFMNRVLDDPRIQDRASYANQWGGLIRQFHGVPRFGLIQGAPSWGQANWLSAFKAATLECDNCDTWYDFFDQIRKTHDQPLVEESYMDRNFACLLRAYTQDADTSEESLESYDSPRSRNSSSDTDTDEEDTNELLRSIMRHGYSGSDHEEDSYISMHPYNQGGYGVLPADQWDGI